ncbi:MAG: hypothetical protein U0869_16505 [Chloroflexota bacterium]
MQQRPVHHIPGRVRFHVPRLARDAAYAKRLADATAGVPGVRQVRINRSAASIVVTYDAPPPAKRDGRLIPTSESAVVAALARCIASAADPALPIAPPARPDGRQAATGHAEGPAVLPPLEQPVDLVRHLGVQILALGLAAATAVGATIPGGVVGAAVLAAAIPHARRAAQGLRTERRPTVEILDVTTCVLLVARSSFLPAAFTMTVIELAEVARQWTARRGVLESSGHATVVRDAASTPDGAGTVASIAAPPERESRVGDHARRTGDWAVTPTLALGALVGAASGDIGRTTGIVSLDMGTGMRVSAPVAVLVAQDHALRSDILFRSGRAVELLGRMETVLLGDADADARPATVQALGEDGVSVERMPRGLSATQRAERVLELQASGRRVAVLVRDRRDIPAAVQADLAVTFGSADDACLEAADVVLLRDSLDDLLDAIGISRHTMSLLRQNQKLVIGANIAGITYGVLTPLSPIGGVLLNNGVSLIALLNGLRRPAHARRPSALIPLSVDRGTASEVSFMPTPMPTSRTA